MTVNLASLQFEVHDVDDRHREVAIDSVVGADNLSPDLVRADGAPRRQAVLARRHAAGVLARIGLILLPEIAETRKQHKCGPEGLRWDRDEAWGSGAWWAADGCHLTFPSDIDGELLAPATSDWGSPVGICLTVPTEDVDRWVRRLQELLAIVAADDAAIPEPDDPRTDLAALRALATPTQHPAKEAP